MKKDRIGSRAGSSYKQPPAAALATVGEIGQGTAARRSGDR